MDNCIRKMLAFYKLGVFFSLISPKESIKDWQKVFCNSLKELTSESLCSLAFVCDKTLNGYLILSKIIALSDIQYLLGLALVGYRSPKNVSNFF